MKNVKKNCIVVKGIDSNFEKSDYVLQFKEEAKKVIDKIVTNSLYILVHN